MRIDILLGSHLKDACVKAQELVKGKISEVEFEFNNVLCKVSKDTDLDLLYRDYCNAHLLKWKVIGPTCREYSEKLIAKIESKSLKAAKHEKDKRAKLDLKNKKEGKSFKDTIKEEVFKCRLPKEYDDWKANNTDGYNAVIFKYAEQWARRLQIELAKPYIKNSKDLLKEHSLQPNYLGITGFQHACAESILKECWLWWILLK